MARRVVRAVPGRVTRGLVTTLGPADHTLPMTFLQTEHPSPGSGSLAAGRLALDLAHDVQPDRCLLVLLSGGASSMMSLPLDGVTVGDKAETAGRLMRAGADIRALNVVRKHLSRIKGGRLAAACRGRVLCLAVSDVVGDDVSVIGSGPTSADASSFADALQTLDRYGVTRAVAFSVRNTLERGARGQLAETPKPGTAILERTTTRLIGSMADAMEGATDEATRRGFSVAHVEHPVTGEARVAGARFMATVAPLIANLPRPSCILSGGETTVHVRGTGRGGRNQELVLAAIRDLERLGVALMASIGTDGVDGPTDAAGARADGTSLRRARRLGLESPEAFLDRNNAYEYFKSLGDLIVTGATSSNVGDLQVVLVTE